jgi:membrane protein
MKIFTYTLKGWYQHKIQHLAAAFTFYALLSLGPLMVFFLTISCKVLDASVARRQTIQQLAFYIGPTGAATISKIIDGAASTRHQLMATGIGIIFLYIGASAVFSSLHEALNVIWEVPPGKRNNFFTFVRKQLVTISLVILFFALFLLSLITSTVLAVIGNALHGVKIPLLFLNISELSISIIVFSFLFSFIFKIVPDAPIKWRDVRLGAFVTSILFNSGKFFISRIFGHSEILLSYGSLASFFLIIVWVYISAQIVLLGAEFTRAHILLTASSKKKNFRKRVI